MSKMRGKSGGGQRPPVTAVAGSRAAIERAWLTAVMCGADPQRIAQLERMLTPAANDGFEATVLPPEVPPKLR